MERRASGISSKLQLLLPAYAWVPVAAVLFINMAVYYITKFTVPESARHIIDMSIDRAIPVVPFFILLYVLCFPQWAVSWIMIGREDRRTCFRLAKADIIAKIICLILFIVYPTIIERPSIETADFFSWALKFVYSVDRPYNCFPSIHMLASWICMRAALKLKKPGTAYKAVMVLITVMCAFAVVLTKQHYVIDVPAGILAAEIGLAISKRLDNEKFLWIR
ncbi:MAG: phosphatase PAP2 family protein [Firmicutes bacterium]|nr:phosphatase PAP2 family protein [Bacillota bacterium]